MPGTSARLLLLLSLLEARRDWPAADLANRLEVSRRTVRRDIDRLRVLGYPIEVDLGPGGAYRLGAGAELPPLLFDDEQAMAIAVALQTPATSVPGMDEAAARALATIRQVMPARLRHRLDALELTSVGRGRDEPPPPVDPDVLVAAGAAVRAREVLRFDYGSQPGARGPVPPRRVEPHHLVLRAGRWYLLAWDLDRTDWRTFRLDRINPRLPTGPRFAPRELPGGDVAAFVSSRFDGAGGTGGADRWPCHGEVVLEAPAALVARWAPGRAVVEELGPARCRLLLGAWSWVGLAALAGTFDAPMTVIGPPELARACAELSRRYAEAAVG